MNSFIKSIFFYCIICMIVIQIKPSIFYDKNNKIKPLNMNTNDLRSFISLHTFILLLALFIY
jgi:hypothetical protein